MNGVDGISRRLRIGLPATATIAVFAMVYAAIMWNYVIDDAYITFAYARNFAETGSLVIRPGDYVSANSTPAWALMLGLLSALAGTPPVWAKIAGALFFAAALTCMVAAFLPSRRASAPLMLALVGAASSPFALWSNYGMELGLYAFAVWLLAFSTTRPQGWRGLTATAFAAALVGATRPEGFMVVAALVGLAVVRRALVPEPAASRWFMPILVASGAVGAVLGLQSYYYGSILPNSATAKITSSVSERLSEGTGYLFATNNLLGGWVVLVAILWVLLDTVKTRGRYPLELLKSSPLVSAGLVVAGLQVLLVLMSGRDWMPNGRFLAVSSPFCAMYMVWRMSTARWPEAHRWRTAALALFLVSWGYTQLKSDNRAIRVVLQYHGGDMRALQQLVDDLNPISTETDMLGVSDIGRPAYAYVGRIFDWWGLASTLVSSRDESLGRISPGTVYEVSPSFLVLYSNHPTIIRSATSGAFEYTTRFLQDNQLNERYCFVKSYEYLPYRKHVLLVRRDLHHRVRLQPAFSAESRAACQPAFRP